MKSKIYILIFILFLSLIGCSNNYSINEESDIAYIQEKGILTVGMNEFKPMDYRDESGEWIGFDAELAKLVADDLGVEIEFVVIDWDNRILEIENKSIDVVWNGMTLNTDMLNALECTQPYLKNAQVVLVDREIVSSIQSEEDMYNLQFVVEAGSAGENVAIDFDLNYIAVATQSDALLEVSAGTSEAAIVDLLMAGAMIGEHTSFPDLEVALKLDEEEYGVGCRKGSDLVGYINQEFEKFNKENVLEKLAEKYGIDRTLIIH